MTLHFSALQRARVDLWSKQALIRFIFCCLIFAPAVVAAADSPAARAAHRLPLQACPAEWGEEEILCGNFEVLENRALAGGRKLSLKILVIPALAEQPDLDPIFFLEGGPGVAATDAAYYFARESQYRLTRDIVLVDLRGMGGSNPLHCDLVGDSAKLQNYLQEMYPPELVSKCREQLSTRADLTQYTTTAAMQDLEEVRVWLGYEKINLLGISYGGRVAFVYARAYPERVRSIALIGPASIDLKLPLHHARQAEKAFDSLFADCRADSACNEAFPNLEAEMRGLVNRLRSEKVSAAFANSWVAESTSVVISADGFVETLRTAMYSVESSRRVPWIIHQAASGNFAPYLDRVIPDERGYPPFLAEGAYLSITGAEDAPFITEAESESLTAGTMLGNYRVFQQQRAASLWPVGALPENYFNNLSVAAPTLIIQGGRDPVIPPGSAIRFFSRGRELVIPQMAHMEIGLSNVECVDALILEFFTRAEAGNLDTTCVRSMLPPPFKTAN